MTNKTEARKHGKSQNGTEFVPQTGLFSAVREAVRTAAGRLESVKTAVSGQNTVRLLQMLRSTAVFFAALLFAGAQLFYETHPLGLAFLCAQTSYFPAALAGILLSLLLPDAKQDLLLYLGAVLCASGLRYMAGRLLLERKRDRGEDTEREFPGDGVLLSPAARIRRAIFPPGVFAQTAAQRTGIALLASCPAAAGYLLGGSFSAESLLCSAYFLCTVPVSAYLFCGLTETPGGVSAAHREAGIGAFCYALTASFEGTLLFGFSVRLICAQLLTLYISKKSGYLRGGLCGLICGLACDALYAPGYALIGAVSGLFWGLHPAPAVILSLSAGMAYAVYVGEFAAIRSVVPEMMAASALAYPAARYLHLPAFLTAGTSPKQTLPCTQEEEDAAPTPEELGVPGLAEQMDALSGILNGLSATFYHISDRVKKPGLYEIRQLCETVADRYCARCPMHELCWEKDFSATADAMGRITLCMHRKGRIEPDAAFAPLDRRCPSLPRMLSSMNEAAAELCEEKLTRDKTEVAAADYEGMAKLLRMSAENSARACAEDQALSRRMTRAASRMGFCAQHVAVYGSRRKTIVASGVDLGLQASGEGVVHGSTLLGTAELREAFSALAGVRYQMPEYRLADGGRNLIMTLRAQPKFGVRCGSWGEKKPGEEVTGDVLSFFANKNDCFYALLCDGMGSGREASVTAQISVLFLEKLLSVSAAKGAALNLLNNFLRHRQGECSATVDLCEIDMITGEAKFVKCGAAASFLLRGDNLFRIASETMPVGILKEVSAEETVFALEDGDLILCFSDGICGECEDSSWIAPAVQESMQKGRAYTAAADASVGGDAPKPQMSPLDAAAKHLGRIAKERIGRRDDMTAAILQIHELL